jgi:hypothetical protein
VREAFCFLTSGSTQIRRARFRPDVREGSDGDAKMTLKWRSYFFDEGEPEIKTQMLRWLGKATEEMDNVNALTVASARL